VAQAEGLNVDPTVLERLALVARGGLRDALSLLDQLSAFAVGDIDMDVARAALSLPSIEAVRGAIDGMTRHDPSAVMAVVADAAEGGADLRLLADELVVHLRALMLLRSGADARLTDELPAAEVAWLRERAPSWSIGVLMQLIQTLSDALARTRDAAQFQVQTEVALLTACDVESLAPPLPAPPPQRKETPSRTENIARVKEQTPSGMEAIPPPKKDEVPPSTEESPTPKHEIPPSTEESPTPKHEIPPSREESPTPKGELPSTNEEVPSPRGEVPSHKEDVPSPKPEVPSPSPTASASPLRTRWPDVIDHVQRRNGLLASIVRSAEPLALEDQVLLVAFSTEFNRKTAEKSTSRQLIEAAFAHAYGTAYRLRCTVANGESGLLDDPVINFAQRTFGGQPKRVSTDQ
jgi:DNA polymerase-3 subunit gamma/tau